MVAATCEQCGRPFGMAAQRRRVETITGRQICRGCADTLLGANDPIAKPAETDALDWEVEFVVVIGQEVRRAE